MDDGLYDFDFDDVVLAVEILAAPPDCPPDPWFQDPTVLNKLRDLWNASNPSAAPGDRQEQGAWIHKTADGYDVTPINNPFPDPCSFNPGTSYYSTETIAQIHTHVFAPGEQFPAGTCLNKPTAAQAGKEGPSSADRATAKKIDQGARDFGFPNDIAHQIIDPNGILDFTVDANGNLVSQQRFGSCGILN